MWIWVNATYFCCGLELDRRGFVVKCPAICRRRYMGLYKSVVKEDLKRRGVLIEWREMKNDATTIEHS